MNKFEKARFEADDRVYTFMTDHDAELSSLSLYSAVKALFVAKFGDLRVAMIRQAEDIKVYTAAKAMYWDIMAASIHKFALRASVQAHVLGLYELELALSKPLTFLLYCEDIDALDRAVVMKDLMKDNLGVLTELTMADIAQMEADIVAFTEVRDKPEDRIKLRKALGTDMIPQLLKDVDIAKNLISKLVQSYLPGLAAEWQERSRIGEPEGIRHPSLVIHYTSGESDIGLRDVTCTLLDNVETHVQRSSSRGWVNFYSIVPRDWSVISELEGYETDIQPCVGIDGEHVSRLEIKLKRKSIAGDEENLTGALELFAYDKDSGLPLFGAQYILNEPARTNFTDEDGQGYEDLILPGPYTGSLLMDGYNDLTFSFSVVAGETAVAKLFLIKKV